MEAAEVEKPAETAQAAIPAEAAPEEHHAVAEEKNEAVAHKLAATQTHKHTKLQTIRFYLRFRSNPGQNLFITAQHSLFRNGNPEEALPMQYLNEETWTATLPVVDSFITEPIVYNYLLKEADGTFVYDAGSDKTIDLKSYAAEEVSIVDSWNVPGYYENAFYTEPFKAVLLKNNYTQTAYTAPVIYTHTFKIKAPLLAQGQVPFIAGGIDALGNWNADETLLLHKGENEDFWSIAIDLTNANFPIEYKYGVYDVKEGKAVQYENGENRTFFDTIAPNKKTIVNDGFIRLPANTWKGAGVAIPVFSLKTHQSFGTGEFTDIKKLADWAKSVGIKMVQILPVNDTTATKTWQDSYPYAAISAFALHAMYLNLSEVVSEENKHFLKEHEEECRQLNTLPVMDYEKVNDIKWKIIHQIYPLQKDAVFNSADYQEFFDNNKHWLVPYAAFCYLRDKNHTADYSRWPEYKTYDERAINKLLQGEEAKFCTGMYCFVQYYLHLQLKDATDYAHSQGIIVKGDIAIGVARYGADTWQDPQLFHLDMQAGAPPDDFAVKGQNWGFPTYDWQKMQEDGFAWWKRRFEQMSRYFDAFRIDHILGFFRIWSIPISAIQGILGRFVPALPVHVSEFHQRGIYFDYNRYVKPFINDQILNDLTGDQQWWIKDTLLNADGNGTYSLKEEVSTQRRVETYFAIREDNPHNQWLKNVLFDLIANVILLEQKGSNGQEFHFRFGIEDTLSYKLLDEHTQWQLKELYVNYFYERQNEFWYHEAMKKLPALKRATNMLICGEDLGMVPATVPRVMNELGLLSLEVQRMPKDQRHRFTHITNAPYLSVVTPSTHDMSTIRGWWEEDTEVTQAFYNEELGQQGEAPQYCEPWINKLVVEQHLQSPAMWSIFQLQDLLGSDESLRRPNPHEERINQPAIPKYYWQYRMHLYLEDLTGANDFNNELKQSIVNSGR
ncbi:4-alpha-glucanotransferase [Ilyomonas limi]|uniref:4-alpha-glucanotransferase n=2 Tax=Ilyomonas limi TaxID=2575867 RepID=A0A4U3L0X5_9BACT|nr:4-alpha-glucanotransferase [Ilyomonas limi]